MEKKEVKVCDAVWIVWSTAELSEGKLVAIHPMHNKVMIEGDLFTFPRCDGGPGIFRKDDLEAAIEYVGLLVGQHRELFEQTKRIAKRSIKNLTQ